MPQETASSPETLTIWRLLDGTPGHEKQTLGLAQAIARLRPATCLDIPLEDSWRGAIDWARRIFAAGDDLPRPDLILCAGHASHFSALAARRAHGGRLVVVMRPSLPSFFFDLCLIPSHDQPPKRANVVATRGALNAVRAGGTHDPRQGLILIGGESAHFIWDHGTVLKQIHILIEQTPEVRWRLSTSRRTPPGFLDNLRESERLELIPHTLTPPGWVESAMAQAGQAWITEDSVSMVYEGLTSGCQVGLLRLPRTGKARVARGIDSLLADNWVATLADWQNGIRLPAPRVDFNEAERCARLIVERWFPAAA
jgi:mitochondrial fission protein ELM1